MYAEIILPLPLYSTFTYNVPDNFLPYIQQGSRVLVQFGRKKFYTGIVSHTHFNTPDYEVKDISDLLDEKPVLRYPQLNLWRWIADYYLCSQGDVMKAALPTGLKPESETFITLTADQDDSDGIMLTDRQTLIVDFIQSKGKTKISDIETELKIKNSTKIISSLLESGVVKIDEHLVERYRPRKETFVKLNISKGDNEALHRIFDKLRRSPQQEKLLIAWLDISGWLRLGVRQEKVTRDNLLKTAGVSLAVLRGAIGKGIFSIEKETVNRFNNKKEQHSPRLSSLSHAQKKALDEIKESFLNRKIALLHGLTGSGKTEIYSHLAAAALADGNNVLYLVPEISLTTQLTDRLRTIFGDRLMVYHSKFSDNERVDIWKRLLDAHEPMIILGVRSSIFLPFSRLGLVIVDEEHESSYKQYDPAPRYNARDAAMVLAGMHGASVLLGSATPSIESYYKALSGKFNLIELPERYEGSVLPDINLIDMRRMRKEKLVSGILSLPLRKSIKSTVESGKQAIVFQNRRGFAPMVICRTCGWTPKCENCDVSLVYHKKSNLLKCHYCGFTRALPNVCPACSENTIETYGYGTERIAEEINEAFPDNKIVRMDLDTTRNKDAYQEIIEEFSKHKTDILVGTQMISKGLDFENVNFVGVANADTLLNFPDFRSNERAFNMLEQVAGRAGRRKEKGYVAIQTTKPEEPVLQFVAKHDYKGYYESEIAEREKYRYPPFTKVINIYLKNKDARIADRIAIAYTRELQKIFGNRVLGPEKPFVSRVALWYIQSVMLKVEANASMNKVKEILHNLYEKMATMPEMKTSIIYYDVDPS